MLPSPGCHGSGIYVKRFSGDIVNLHSGQGQVLMKPVIPQRRRGGRRKGEKRTPLHLAPIGLMRLFDTAEIAIDEDRRNTAFAE